MKARVIVATSDADVRGRVGAALESTNVVIFVSDRPSLVGTVRDAALDALVVDVAWVTRELVDSSPAPVIALVTDDVDEVTTALDQGCDDVIRASAPGEETAARVAVATRLARADQDVRAARAELADATRTDHLTGLANRRHVDEHLAMAASGARRHRQAMSLLLVDIDHLRRVNDAIGHAAGDTVIRTLATRLAHVLRGEDMGGRWAGDEFLVVAPSTDLDGAWRLGERIREAVSASPVPLDGGRDVLVTVSIGCSTGPGDDLEAQLRQAEHALSQARDAGRNRVVVTDASIMS